MYTVGDTIRMPDYPTVGEGAYRVWKIVGCHLGATNQEGTYSLVPLDIRPNEQIQVPCVMLDKHPGIERV